MSTKHLIYTTGLTLYGKAVEASEPWASDVSAITEDATYAGIYPADTAAPHIYVQAGGSPASGDEYLGDVREFYYGSVAGGDLYHATRFHSWDWTNATLEDKVRALYTATHAVDKFKFVGTKTVATQGLEFPRTRTRSDGTVCLIGGVADVPPQIPTACYLICEALLSGRDPEADFESQNVKVETFGAIRTEFATNVGPMEHIANLIPSPSAWALVLPFLSISRTFEVNKG